jgi:hypothetical protein
MQAITTAVVREASDAENVLDLPSFKSSWMGVYRSKLSSAIGLSGGNHFACAIDPSSAKNDYPNATLSSIHKAGRKNDSNGSLR